MCPRVHAVSRKVFVLGLVAGCTSSQPKRPPDPCGGTVSDVPLEPGVHVPEGTQITWNSNPPTSGMHYPIWAGYDRHYDALDRGYWVHDLEHGAIVYAYRCDAGCADIAAMLDGVVKALPADSTCAAPPKQRSLVVADPMLPSDGMVVAVSWGHFYAANMCADETTLVDFYFDHVARAPEDTCNDGVAFTGTPID